MALWHGVRKGSPLSIIESEASRQYLMDQCCSSQQSLLCHCVGGRRYILYYLNAHLSLKPLFVRRGDQPPSGIDRKVTFGSDTAIATRLNYKQTCSVLLAICAPCSNSSLANKLAQCPPANQFMLWKTCSVQNSNATSLVPVRILVGDGKERANTHTRKRTHRYIYISYFYKNGGSNTIFLFKTN